MLPQSCVQTWTRARARTQVKVTVHLNGAVLPAYLPFSVFTQDYLVKILWLDLQGNIF